MRTLWLACLLFGALGWSRAYAQDADALLAQSKLSAGGDAWNDIRSLSVTSEGTQGGNQVVEEQHFDVGRGHYLTSYRIGSFDTLGRAENAEGYDGKVAWEIDPSGYSHTVTDAGSLRRIVNESYLASYAYWFPRRAPAERQYAGRKREGGKDFDVVRILPKGGQPIDLWMDAKTHLIDRFVEQGPTQAVTTFFSDYSAAGDLKFPFTMRHVYAKSGPEVTNKVRQVETGTGDAKASFGIPAPPQQDYQMPADQDSVTIPFQLVGGYIFVPIFINGKGPFMADFDTGSSSFVIAPAIAKELKLATLGTVQGVGLGSNLVSGSLVAAEAVQIGGVTLSHPTLAVLDMGGMPLDAIVGYEVLRRFVVRVDNDAHLLTLTRPDKFIYRGSSRVLSLHLHGNTPAIDGMVDGVKGLFALDTGSGGTLDLFGPFIQAHDLRHKYGAGFTVETGMGLGGTTRAQSVRIGSLNLGTSQIREVTANLTADQGGETSDSDIAGNIGETVLRQFNITFDYTHEQVILERSKKYGQAEDGHAGFSLEQQGNAWRVSGVTPGSAAAQAGIREGDLILQINSKDVGQLSLFASLDVFDHPVGTKMWMLLQTGGQKRLVAVTLGKVP